MPIIDCDTKKLKDYGKEMMLYANDFKKIINHLYSQIDNIDKTDINWNQYNPKDFINEVYLDKSFFDSLYDELITYSTNCQLSSQIIEESIRNTIDE